MATADPQKQNQTKKALKSILPQAPGCKHRPSTMSKPTMTPAAAVPSNPRCQPTRWCREYSRRQAKLVTYEATPKISMKSAARTITNESMASPYRLLSERRWKHKLRCELRVGTAAQHRADK